jgi:hypothetical protein
VDKLEQHVESLRKATFSSGQDQPTLYSQNIDAQFSQQLSARQVSPKADDGFVFVECGSTKQLPPDLLTLACAHYVKWEHADNFRKWTEKITQEMARYPGFVGLTTIEPSNEDDPFINTFTFSNLQNLMSFFGSEVRKQLLLELEVMLQGTSIAEVARERVLGDAFSELFVSTGGLGTASNIIIKVTSPFLSFNNDSFRSTAASVEGVCSRSNPNFLDRMACADQLLAYIGGSVQIKYLAGRFYLYVHQYFR